MDVKHRMLKINYLDKPLNYNDESQDGAYWLRLGIGYGSRKGSDDYVIFITTPEALLRNDKFDGWFITNPQTLVVSEFNWPEIELYLHEVVKSCSLGSYSESVEALCQFFYWEFDNYNNIESSWPRLKVSARNFLIDGEKAREWLFTSIADAQPKITFEVIVSEHQPLLYLKLILIPFSTLSREHTVICHRGTWIITEFDWYITKRRVMDIVSSCGLRDFETTRLRLGRYFQEDESISKKPCRKP